MSELDPNGPPRAVYLSTAPARESARCLVLDAAFNPPTIAHWQLAIESQAAARADRILLQLSAANVDKGVSGADLGQRLYMLEAIAASRPNVYVSVCSHARFIDKAIALERLSPGSTHVFAIGYDTLIRLFDPKYYTDMASELETVFSKAEFAVANRADNDPETLSRYLEQSPQSRFCQKIHQVTLPDTVAHVSSSRVRERIGQGQDATDLLPAEVSPIIRQMGLYID